MENGTLVALILKLVNRRLADLPVVPGPRGHRGTPGLAGLDGKEFVFAEHESTIRSWVDELTLKFEDLTAAQIEAVRGPRGRDGTDGKDFAFVEHSADIQALIKQAVADTSESLKLKFADLSADEIEAIRGKSGQDGRSFIFEEHKDAIESIINESVDRIRENLKLRFEDLNVDDIERIRGPRGRDGRDGTNGRDFEFEEHREFFQSLKPKFSDFTAEERETLRLQFSHLTEEERSTLKLRFENLTEEDRALIRGARGHKGQKGRPGNDGDKGDKGDKGDRGNIGPRGISIVGKAGRNGFDGREGIDGKDAPYVTDIKLEEFPVRNEIAFEFHFSDGSTITTETVKLPQHTNIYVEGASGGGGSGQGGGGETLDYETQLDEATASITYVGKAAVGSDTAGAVWQVKRISVSGTVTSIEFADSNANFDNVWDNRASLTYG